MTTNDKTTTMPTTEWFAALPEDRRETAIKASSIYTMMTSETKRRDMLLTFSTNEFGVEVSEPPEGTEGALREILEVLPEDNAAALLAAARWKAIRQMDRTLEALKMVCPDAVRVESGAMQTTMQYLGGVEKHVLHRPERRKVLWDAAMVEAGSDEVRRALRQRFKALVRDEYVADVLDALITEPF